METSVQKLLDELERFGQENDAATKEHSARMLNITPDTGVFLQALMHATAAKRVLEIGTSNGYSTLWLADAAKTMQAAVTTVESSAVKARMAEANFRRSGLDRFISLRQEDAAGFLARAEDASYDLIFLDAHRPQYPKLWADLKRVLTAGGTLVVDNATSHPEEMAPFAQLVGSDPDFLSSLLPIGKGELFAVKRR